LLPFTAQQFFSVFADYNQAVWRMQWILAAAAAGIVLLSISRTAWKDRAICVLLAGLWAWMAIAYHVAHFSRINAYPAEPTFGVPCPTTIFTLGILALAHGRRVATLAVVPLLWSVVGGSAAFLLGIWQDLGLIASGIGMATLLVVRRPRARG
jgi:hypothetical protein